MSRARLIPPEFWTSEAVVDCPPMTRLLLLGLANFADDFGVLPLRPRTIRLQVFPGDAIDDDQVRAMLDELVARGLLRRYAVDGVEYLAIVDWMIHQRVGRHARRRYPADPSDTAPSAPGARDAAAGRADERSPPDHGKPWQSLSAGGPEPRGETQSPPDAAAWPGAVDAAPPCARADDLPADRRELADDVPPATIEQAAGVPSDPRQPLRAQAVDAASSRMQAAFTPASAPSAVGTPTP